MYRNLDMLLNSGTKQADLLGNGTEGTVGAPRTVDLQSATKAYT
jgi:hypothetical protein